MREDMHKEIGCVCDKAINDQHEVNAFLDKEYNTKKT